MAVSDSINKGIHPLAACPLAERGRSHGAAATASYLAVIHPGRDGGTASCSSTDGARPVSTTGTERIRRIKHPFGRVRQFEMHPSGTLRRSYEKCDFYLFLSHLKKRINRFLRYFFRKINFSAKNILFLPFLK
jgi:hypothetical protein